MQVNQGKRSFLLPLKTVHLQGKIGGPIGQLSVTHTFSIKEDEMSGPVEAVYSFPLPGDAAVRFMEVRFGDSYLKTELKALDEAREKYNGAKATGRDAALLVRDKFDTYTLRISGLSPGKDVCVTTHYIQMGDHYRDGFAFRVPLTTPPLYSDDAAKKKNQPLLLKDPGHTFSMDVSVECGVISSATHQLTLLDNSVSLADREVKADRDLVLRWSPTNEGVRSMVMVGTGRRKPFIALVAPERETDGLPRDVIILVDHSGSMEGSKWESADWAVERFLSNLREDDRFNLCLFHSETKWLWNEPLAASKKNVDKALQFLKDKSTGGTRLKQAIEEALAQPRANGNLSRHLLTITDGQVEDAKGTLGTIMRESKRNDSRRCSVICIDSSPNDFLSRQIAKRSGGTAHFLTSDPNEGDITTALDGIMDTFSSPLATGLMLKSDRKTSLGRKVGDEYLSALPDMVPARVNCVMGLLSVGKGKPEFCMDGIVLPTIETGAVNALFATMRINEMEILKDGNVRSMSNYQPLIDLGFSHEALWKQYLATGAKDWDRMEDVIKSLIVEESLKGGVISSQTAMVVTGQKGKKVVATVEVPNAWPQGWDDPCLMRLAAPPRTRHDKIIACSYSGPIEPCRNYCPSSNESYEQSIPDALYPSHKCFESDERQEPIPSDWNLFQGKVVHEDGSATLFQGPFPEKVVRTFRKLSVDGGLKSVITGTLMLFVGDMGNARVSVDLQDLQRAQGKRPVNLVIKPGEEVRLMIVGGKGLEGARMEVTLS